MAKAATRVPAAALGVTPTGQPFAGATFTVGMSVSVGSGSTGSGPVSAPADSCDRSAHPASPSTHKSTSARFMPPMQAIYVPAALTPHHSCG